MYCICCPQTNATLGFQSHFFTLCENQPRCLLQSSLAPSLPRYCCRCVVPAVAPRSAPFVAPVSVSPAFPCALLTTAISVLQAVCLAAAALHRATASHRLLQQFPPSVVHASSSLPRQVLENRCS